MNRREFLQCAAILVSGASAAPVSFSLTQEQRAYLATAPNYNGRKVNFFSASQRAAITAMTECIIPRTETPGAIDAGVPQFVELMVADWLNDEERAIFMAGLADIESRVPREHGAAFDKLAIEEQTEILEALEKAASDSPWYEFGNVMREFISDAPFICQLKELTVWGFFTSEVGGTQVLRYDPMPMRFDGETPLGRDDSTWATISI